ncbi:TM2 domain-containing protein [Corynebacterium striatum]|uniref:TM2 domain-containing protein n=1 Tax=Corynebacterium striatum TaxID=43770 RepID=UPI000665E250|nr:TM2 domain-containing protein [Corynebacterium striatum]
MTYPNNGFQQGNAGGQPVNPFGQPQGNNVPAQFQGGQPQYGQGYSAPQQFSQPQYGQAYPMQQQYAVVAEQKSWVAAWLLAFFFGYLGAHNFYLGNTGRALGQLLGFIFGCITVFVLIGFFVVGFISLWAFVEFIMILAGAGGFDRDAQGVPLRK